VTQATGVALVTAVLAITSQFRKDLGNFFSDGRKSRYAHKKIPLKKLFP
jgi:hypothetical protein